MLELFIKYFVIIFCIFYIYRKLLYIKISTRMQIIHLLCSAFLAVFVYFTIPTLTFLVFFPILLIVILLVYQYENNWKITVVTTLISFGLSYLIFFLAVLLVLPAGVLMMAFHISEQVNDVISFFLIGGIQFLLVWLVFHIKRFRKGMPFLKKENIYTPGIWISISILISIASLYLNPTAKGVVLFFCFIFVSGMLLFFWWKNGLSVTYTTRRHQNEITQLESQLQQKEEKIQKLTENNAALARIIHKDNKLIPAMEYSVKELYRILQQDSMKPEEVRQQAADLLLHLEKLSAERTGILSGYEKAHKYLPQTGNVAVDSIIRYMCQKALQQEAHFDFLLNGSVKYLLETEITEEQLTTLIADLIENALIAERTSSTKNILLGINIKSQMYVLDVYDSGVPFAPEVIAHMGQQQITTHADTGGSGIGLMETIHIARTCHASVEICELAETHYTKCVSIHFDGLEEIRIRSNRPEVLALSENRRDISFKKL